MVKLKRFLIEVFLKVLGYVSPRHLAGMLYRLSTGRWIDWKHPRDINEKIQWLKFYGDTTQWPRLADKYAVRAYVAEKGLEDILVPLIGKWDRAEDIEWDKLPNQFVMKTNHGSGDALVCTDKSSLDTMYYTRFFAKMLKEKFGRQMGEPHYDKIKPCIIAEELLDATKQSFPSSSLIDYKLYCFNGKPSYFFVCLNRTKKSCEVGIYDTDWNFYPQYTNSVDHYRFCPSALPRPRNLDEMLKVAERLTTGFPCVRLDLYEVDNHLYFGEMTFTPASGLINFHTREFLDILGGLCEIK